MSGQSRMGLERMSGSQVAERMLAVVCRSVQALGGDEFAESYFRPTRG